MIRSYYNLLAHVAVAVIILLRLGSAAPVYAQSPAFTITPVVRSGDPITGGGAFSFRGFSQGIIEGNHGLNDKDQVVIFGLLLSDLCTGSVFVASNGSGTEVANACRQTEFGRFSAFFGANINNAGQIALNIGPIINNKIVLMILLYSNGQLTKIAAVGDESPAGTIFGGTCGFGPPSVNDNGDLAFYGCADPDSQGRVFNGVYAYSGGTLRTVLKSGDSSPLGGEIGLTLANPLPVSINNRGDVLFIGTQLDNAPGSFERDGLFLARPNGTIDKVELGRDVMPNGSTAASNSVGQGTLNNLGDVAFGVLLSRKPKFGVYLFSGGSTTTIALQGQPTPIGGTLDLLDPHIPNHGYLVNDSRAVVFAAGTPGSNRTHAIFMASAKAMVEVAAIGDRLPTGEKIRAISSFALNSNGEVAFFVTRKNAGQSPVGVYLATPISPSISSVTVKRKPAGPKLVIDGAAFIANDSVVQVNGQPVQTEYPSAFRQSGGTTTRLVSRDPKLAQLLTAGETVQITVVNSLTARTSEAFSFTP